MADEFQTGICSSNWWTSSRSPFTGASSPSSTSLSEMGSFGWSSSATDMARSSCQEAASVSGNPIVFQDRHRAVEPSESVADSNLDLMDSALHMSGFGLSTPTIDWNPALPRGSGRAESNFQTMLQQELSSRQNLRQETATDSGPVQKDWMHCDFSSGEDSLITFKPANQGFAFEQQRSNSSSGDCTLTTQSHPSNTYSMSTVSYGYPSTMLQGLFEPDTLSHQTSFDQTQTVNYSASTNNYHMNSNDHFPQSNWPKIPQFLKISHPIKQHASNQLHLSNSNTSFWNPSTVSDDRTSLYSSPLPQYLTQVSEDKPRCSNLSVKRNADEIRDSCSATKKGTSEATFKRPRVETPSPLPTFKVRKEKLGDRITALQQLVSPFGKTDTASVLYEAIEYIRFLHDQISVSITPYMKSGAPMKPQQNEDIASKDGEGAKQDLRTRGLCLVPISSTFLVTNETTADFWTPYIWRNVQVDRDTC